MNVFLFLIVYIVICAWFCFVHDGCVDFHHNRIIFLRYCFVAFALVMGLRASSVGIDTPAYGEIYYHISNASLTEICSSWTFGHVEIGFALFMKLCSYIYDDYQFFIFVSSCLYCYLVYIFIKECTENYLIGAVLFLGLALYHSAFSGIRYHLAMAFHMIGWMYCLRKEKAKCLLTYLIAISFHISSFVFVLAYVLYCIKSYKAVLKAGPILILICYIFRNIILYYGILLVPKYENYLMVNNGNLLRANFIWIPWIITLIIATVFLYFVPSKDCNLSLIYADFSFFIIACNLVSMEVNWISRFGEYFVPFMIIQYENFGKVIGNISLRRIYYIGLSVCYMILFYISVSGYLSNYSFFFWE